MIGSVILLLAALTSAAPKAEVRNVRISSPKINVSRERSESPVQLSGQFKVEMSFASPTVHKPVVRLSCLHEIGGGLMVNTKFLDRPDTVAGMSSGEIARAFKAAGITVDAKQRETIFNDPAQFTPHLGQVGKDAYASAVYGSANLKNGFFKLGKSERMPKLLLFRIEVWQNGVLVAKHESSHAGLAGYDLPSDWYAWKKYPQKFKYSSGP